MTFSMTPNIDWTVEQRSQSFYETHCLSTGTDSLNLKFKCTSGTLNAHVNTPTALDSLHVLPFSDTITSYRKTSVLQKLINITFAEFFTSHAKID